MCWKVNPTLQQATENGMELHYLDRETYRKKVEPEFLQQLQTRYRNAYLIPEGGTNDLALKGCVEMVAEIKTPFDVLCSSAGTGGTAAGLLIGLDGEKELLVFSSLKGDFLTAEINGLTQTFNGKTYRNWRLETDYHFGGYAKVKPELLTFIRDFHSDFGIPLEPVYTGKLFFGLFDLIQQDRFAPGTRIMAIHSGGLQGLAGFKEQLPQLFKP